MCTPASDHSWGGSDVEDGQPCGVTLKEIMGIEGIFRWKVAFVQGLSAGTNTIWYLPVMQSHITTDPVEGRDGQH
jgi:hypothetical protein